MEREEEKTILDPHKKEFIQSSKCQLKMNNDDEEIVPFEWLTNFASLSLLLDPSNLFPNSGHEYNENSGHEHNETESSTRKTDDKENNYSYKMKKNNIIRNLNVLHIGCGSSTLGENLMRRYEEYKTVINVDNDDPVLNSMNKRWIRLLEKWNSNKEGRCLWKHLDFNHVDFDDVNEHKENGNRTELQFQLKRNTYDLVLDKSTLDCALCSGDASSGLIYNAYNSLKPDGGVYFVISFHSVDLILPMLKNCPGLDWKVRHFVVPRKVDSPSDIDLQNKSYTIDSANDQFDFEKMSPTSPTVDLVQSKEQQSWSNEEGTFQPNESYRKFVNVFICKRYQRQHNDDHSSCIVDRDAMRHHIHDCNDLHYKNHNPMVTHVRKEHIKKRFLEQLALEEKSIDDCDCADKHEKVKLELRVWYQILFTEAEKEHLTFDYFLEDYEAFSKEHISRQDNENGMTLTQAIDFLETMQ